MSSRLKEKYPEQMTIVLQYQFWDLKVHEAGFSVSLSFSDIAEKLEIPFASVRGFYDPSVNFELEFDVQMTEEDGGEITTLPSPEMADGKPAEPARPSLTAVETTKARKPAQRKKAAPERPEPEKAVDKPTADVVSLDQFRKK
jgi:hypothetical protein